MAKKRKSSPAKTIAPDFVIEPDSVNGFTMTIRCQEYSISREDDLAEPDLELWSRIENLLNSNAAELLDYDGESDD